MKAMLTAACLATVCTLAAGAQGQSQGQTQQQPTPQRSDVQQPALTLSGCLERDTETAAAAGAAGAQAPMRTEYKLTNATKVPAPAAAGGTTPPPAGQQQDSDKDKKEYRLTSSTDVDLSKHVGHQVEVVGNIVKGNAPAAAPAQPAQATGTGQQPPQPRTGQQADDKDDDPLLKVSSVRMVATTCR